MPHEALRHVLDEIASAARQAGRLPGDVKLVAVSKTFASEAIRPVLDAGHRIFGENRVQEAQQKWPQLREQYDAIELHLIGPLQSNKAKDAVALFDAIHSIDRPKIAEAVAREIDRQNRKPMLFVQVNTGEEPQKAGILPSETAAFLALCRNEHKLDITGLMCIPPIDEEPSVHFAFLAKLAKEHSAADRPLALSMGMSADYKVAITFGATHVRVGSAIFGARTQH
jgi:PLP dependent protein